MLVYGLPCEYSRSAVFDPLVCKIFFKLKSWTYANFYKIFVKLSFGNFHWKKVLWECLCYDDVALFFIVLTSSLCCMYVQTVYCYPWLMLSSTNTYLSSTSFSCTTQYWRRNLGIMYKALRNSYCMVCSSIYCKCVNLYLS